jgi:hypothetical protein
VAASICCCVSPNAFRKSRVGKEGARQVGLPQLSTRKVGSLQLSLDRLLHELERGRIAEAWVRDRSHARAWPPGTSCNDLRVILPGIFPSEVTGVDSDGVGELVALAALGPPRDDALSLVRPPSIRRSLVRLARAGSL